VLFEDGCIWVEKIEAIRTRSAPKDMRLSKTVLALRLPKSPSKEKPAIHDTTID
jgi:hypothetical protein